MGSAEPIKNVEDIEKINEYLKNKCMRDYVIWQMGLSSGLRISDILRLNVSDVQNKTHITVTEQKTGKLKKFPITEKLKKILDDYIKGKNGDEPLFCCIRKKQSRMNRREAHRFLEDACKKCNIDINIGTHTMRKTFGYHHYQQFHDAVLLQKIFNHSHISITLIYIGVQQDEIDSSYKRFDYNKKAKKTDASELTEIKKEIKVIGKRIDKLISLYLNLAEKRAV